MKKDIYVGCVRPEGSFKSGINIPDLSDGAVHVDAQDPQTFAKHSKVLRGHADVDFSATIRIEKENHKNITRRKPYSRKLKYDSSRVQTKDG